MPLSPAASLVSLVSSRGGAMPGAWPQSLLLTGQTSGSAVTFRRGEEEPLLVGQPQPPPLPRGHPIHRPMVRAAWRPGQRISAGGSSCPPAPDTDVLITYSAPTPVGPHDASLLGLFVSALATWLLPRPPATVRSIRQAQEHVRILTSGCFTLRIKVYRSKFACWRDLHAPYFRTDPEGSV